MKKFYLFFLSSFCFLSSSFAQTLINPVAGGGFDLGNTFPLNGWNVVNSSANKWVVGSTTFNSPPNSAYISSDGNVANYSYVNSTAHISHFYQQVIIPANTTNVSLSFQLKGNVENDINFNLVDGLEIYTDESLTLPAADVLPGGSAVQQFFQFNNNVSYIGQTINLNSLAGKTVLIIFTWKNDGNGIGSGPPASVDGISLKYCIKNTNYNLTGGGGFCTGSAGTNVGLAGSVIGISYQLYHNGSPVGSPVAGTGSPLDFGPQNVVGNYTVVGTSGACTYNMPGSVDVTENPLPIATAGSNSPLCSGSALNLTSGGGSTYSWTGPNSFTSLAQNPSITNVTIAASGTYTVTVTDGNGCPAPATIDVIVTPANTLTLSSAAGTDAQSTCINTPITNITYTTTGATGASFINLPAGVTGSWASNVITISGTPTALGIYNYTVTLTGGCTISANGSITVTTGNTITLSSAAGTNAQTSCINTAITDIIYTTTAATGASFSGLPAGVTGSWAANVVTISGTPTALGTSNYIVTLTGGCGNITANGSVTVTTGNTIALSSAAGTDAQSVCTNMAITDITYATTGATGASFSNLPAGVTGAWASNIVTISGAPTTIVGSPFNYTVTLTGGCGNITANGSLTVTTGNTLVLSSGAGTDAQSVCTNASITDITYTTTGATGASFSGLPTGVTGSWASNVVTISGSPTTIVGSPFNYTVTLTGGCGSATANGSITVTTGNSITFSSAAGTDAQAICLANAITDIIYTTTGATGATFSGLPTGVTGSWASNVITISGAPTTMAGSPFNYIVTLTGGCGNIAATGTITVTPAAAVSLTSVAGSDVQTICNGSLITDIIYAVNNAAGASVTGLPTGLIVSPGAGALTISGTPSQIGTFTYTVTTTGGCGIATATGTITVEPANGGAVASVSICMGGSGSLTLSGLTGTVTGWEYSTDSTSASWTPVANSAITQTFTGITVPTFYRALVSNGCGNVKSSIATVSIHNYWTGADGTNPTDWNTPANWSDNLVPSALFCDDVYIPNTTNKPILSNTPVATIKNLYIFAGASLTVNGAGLLQIAGTISNLGIFDVTDGTLELNGTGGAQNIAGSLFKLSTVKNLTISNNADVANALNDTLNISGTLAFGNTTADLTTGDNITLKSTLTATANVGVLSSGNIITGNVTVERYIATGNTGVPNHGKSWQLLAIPTTGQTIKEAWQEAASASNIGAPPAPSTGNPVAGYGTMITSNVANAATQPSPGFDGYTSPGPSIKYYNPVTNVYDGPPNTSSTPIYNKKGYFVFVRGDRSVTVFNQAANPTILRTKGTLFTPANPPQPTTLLTNEFASVGNPYASPIDFRLVPIPGLAFVYQVWDPRLGGAFNYGAFQTLTKNGAGNYTVTPGGGSYGAAGSVHNYIQSGQAFFVQTIIGSTGSISFTEAVKANTASSLFTTPARAPQVEISLRTTIYNVNGGADIIDGVLNDFDGSYSNSIDGMDARKNVNTGENLSIKTGGRLLAVERRQPVTGQDTIFLNLTGVKAQAYRFGFDAANMNTVGMQGFLEDTYLNTRKPLDMNGNTMVDFTIVNIPGSYAANRFRIVFTPLAALPVTFTSLKAYRQDKNINVEWRVDDERGMKQYELEKSNDGVHFTTLEVVAATANNGNSAIYVSIDIRPVTGYNYYRLKSVDINGKTAYTNVVKVLMGAMKKDIVIYPNPVTNGIIHLQLINQPEGKYGIRLLNQLGQVIVVKQISHAKGSTTEVIKWDYSLAHGAYKLEVTKPDGSIKNIIVMY